MIVKNKEKFIYLTNKRVNKALKEIRLIGNLSNKNNYQYTKDQRNQIIKALEDELIKCKKILNNKHQKVITTFKLKSTKQSK